MSDSKRGTGGPPVAPEKIRRRTRAARPLRLRRSGEEHGRAARAPLEVPATGLKVKGLKVEGLKVKGLKVKGLKVESRRRANVELTFDV